MEGCNMCQKMKNRTKILIGKLKLSEVLEKLQIHLIVNLNKKLPLVARKDIILVVCDRLSKMTHFMATTEGILAERLARLFQNNIWKLYELPESIVLDRGLQFAAEITNELNSMLDIEAKLLTAFYPQTDGQIEKINQEL